MPASVMLNKQPWRTGVAGTVWNGEVGVSGGTKFEWNWAPLRSLTSLGFAADWHATGPDTDMGGRVLMRPGRTVIDKASGSANGSLLAALAPDLGFTCDTVMQVEIARLAIGGGTRAADGTIVTEPGTCWLTGNPAGATSVAALRIRAEHLGQQSTIRVVPQTQQRQTLIDSKLAEDGTLNVTMTPDGAAALPFFGIPAGASIQTTL